MPTEGGQDFVQSLVKRFNKRKSAAIIVNSLVNRKKECGMVKNMMVFLK